MNDDNNKENQQANQPTEEEVNDRYVSVNDYTGEGFELLEGAVNDPVVQANFDEIAAATKQYFRDEFKTEVIVHRAVGAKFGGMIFVESATDPRFHTFAMIPVDAKENKVYPDGIWTESMQVEQALFGGLLAMIMEEEFAALDNYLEEITDKYPVVGMRQEAVNNVTKSGYTTPYYFVQTMSLEELKQINGPYLENPEINIEELKQHFNKETYNAEKMSVVIDLFMKEPNIEPDKAIFQQIINDIETLDGLPRGAYSVRLHDNNISKRSGIGSKDNTLRRGNPDKIIKE
ncbi:Protein of unknown function [Evansella caseinilytica]|uniref:Uncharacterized protein n=1 Tax=Evansella caseinilytica TaxID=1503961 RepID=A0A1H3I2B7_9BACI|nr:Protein of unknown function [Evansella caseinilytica]